MFGAKPVNPNPRVHEVRKIERGSIVGEYDDSLEDPIDPMEVFDIIHDILDPEYPYTLLQLKVVSLENIIVNGNEVVVIFKPTIQQCAMATLIGLCIRVKLMRSLPRRIKYTVLLEKGSHQSEREVNKQLNDKERVFAALENPNLLRVVNKTFMEGKKQ